MTRISRLMAVVLHRGRSRLDVVVQDDRGVYREIRIEWKTRLPTDLPPKNWMEMAAEEVAIQQGNESAAKQGRVLF